MEAVKSLERSREGLPGVRGAERADSDGGNWGGPPRPGSLRSWGAAGATCSITGGPGKRVGAGWASEAAVVLIEPNGQHNRR
jgi:hypothetical protein